MIKRILKRCLEIANDKPLPPPSSDEKQFLGELKATFRELPNLDTANVLPSEEAWFSNTNRLKELVLKQNPREFLRWDVVSETMFISWARYISAELKYLKQHSDWNTRWRNAINELAVGHPTPYAFYPASSGNLIHHAYHIAKFEEKATCAISDMDLIFEFGGGYGSMCRLFHNLGFRGKYVILDLPSFSALQTYYLKTGGFPVLSLSKSYNSKDCIVCISDIEALKGILEQHIQQAHKMFVATWSISEAPTNIREAVLELVPAFHSFLIAYQDRFREVDNLTYFDTWKDTVNHVTWRRWQIEHLSGNNYLVGTRSLE